MIRSAGYYRSMRGFYSRLLNQGGAPWTPANITTVGWWDATDTNTLWADTAGTTPASTTVARWDDKSGGGYNLLQESGTLQPDTGATINSLNALDFTNDRMNTSGNPFGSTVDNGFFILVHKVDSTAVNGIIVSLTGATSPDTSRWQVNAPSTGNNIIFDVRVSAPSTGRLTANYGVIAGSIVLLGAYCSTTDNVQQLWKNGSLLIGDETGHSANTTANGIAVGGNQTVYQNTTIGEVIIINGTVSTDTRQKLEGYLAWKWSLVDDLPSDHPYKGAAPTV